eukprot:scaffold1296_cov659-Prasinococcus_capsulatus_cf.AAC.1
MDLRVTAVSYSWLQLGWGWLGMVRDGATWGICWAPLPPRTMLGGIPLEPPFQEAVEACRSCQGVR